MGDADGERGPRRREQLTAWGKPLSPRSSTRDSAGIFVIPDEDEGPTRARPPSGGARSPGPSCRRKTEALAARHRRGSAAWSTPIARLGVPPGARAARAAPTAIQEHQSPRANARTRRGNARPQGTAAGTFPTEGSEVRNAAISSTLAHPVGPAPPGASPCMPTDHQSPFGARRWHPRRSSRLGPFSLVRLAPETNHSRRNEVKEPS